jgi:hypothetical protein
MNWSLIGRQRMANEAAEEVAEHIEEQVAAI